MAGRVKAGDAFQRGGRRCREPGHLARPVEPRADWDRRASHSALEELVRAARWYRDRLASMSAAEVRYRIVERVKRAASRRRTPALAARSSDRLQALPGLAEGLMALAGDRELVREWRETAERVAGGRIALLGMDWPCVPLAERWHIDPVTGRSWPAGTYCFDVAYRRNHEFGDVKYVWELNRLQHLQPVAALAALDGDAALAQLCCREIESWIAGNRPYLGVNWVSGIELALRVVSIATVASLLDGVGLFAMDRAKLLATLAAHGYWLRRFPSRYSSANNHRVAEAGGLYLLGTLAPDLPAADEWAEYGRAALIAEAQKQIHEDGVGAEQSPTYSAFTLEWLLLCGTLAQRRGRPFPDAYWRRIEAAGEFLRWITDAAGGQPRIGDDDEGQVFRSRLGTEAYVCGVLAALATVVGRRDLAPPRRTPQFREAFFGRAAASDGPVGVRHFATGGYTVARSNHGKGQSLLLFDHGPVGYLSIAAHGHADALALWLHLGGRPVLVDAGTYLYHAGGIWRDHFRSTPAHNTLSIAGTSSSSISGPFNWSSKAAVTVRAFDGDADRWCVEAEHDGFVRRFGVRHRRRVERTGPDDFLITDTLLGSTKALAAEIGFLLHPALTVSVDGRCAIVRHADEALLSIDADAPFTAAVESGAMESLRGWYSPAFGHKEPACRLVFGGRLAVASPCRFSLRLWPRTPPRADMRGAL